MTRIDPLGSTIATEVLTLAEGLPIERAAALLSSMERLGASSDLANEAADDVMRALREALEVAPLGDVLALPVVRDVLVRYSAELVLDLLQEAEHIEALGTSTAAEMLRQTATRIDRLRAEATRMLNEEVTFYGNN